MMAQVPPEPPNGADDGAHRLLARAAAADARSRARLDSVIAGIFQPVDARLDDRTRAALDAVIETLVATVSGELREHGGRLLRGQGEPALAVALAATPGSVTARLWQACLPNDRDFMRELIARTRLDLLAELLPAAGSEDSERPSLLPRLAENPDRIIAASALAVLTADNRRRRGGGGGYELSAGLHHKLVWWVAAALREPHAGRPDVAALDRALVEAALRNLAAYDPGERLEAVSVRLADALAPVSAEYPDLLLEALRDQRATVFVAILAQGLGVPYDATREIVLDLDGERLWLACRALDLPRDAIAWIGLRLAEADGRRDLERFADELDHVAAIPVATARAAIAPLRLHPDYRAALDVLRGANT